MPDLLTIGLLTQARRTAPLLLGVLALFALATRGVAQSVPPGLRACAAESDAGRRLACYDRQMARQSPPPVRRPAEPAPVASVRASSPAPAQQPHAVNPPSPPQETARNETRAPHRMSSWKKIFAGGADLHLTAHVASLDRSPDTLVLHLDNGQVWRQVGRASGDLSLHTGDSVTIEKHLGSYWLSSRYVSNMQVRQEPQ